MYLVKTFRLKAPGSVTQPLHRLCLGVSSVQSANVPKR
jgi:hypothetical protein